MKLKKILTVWAGVWALLAGLLLAGCRSDSGNEKFTDLPGVPSPAPQAAPTAPTPAGQPAPTSSLENPQALKVADVLDIAFSDLPIPQPGFEGPIKEDGTITLMFSESFQAAGKTPGELAKEIRGRYVPAYYKNMTATVTVKDQTYYVGGEVKLSGRQQYVGPITLLKAIRTAGDFTDFARRSKVQLTRADGKTIRIVDCTKALRNPSLDLPVYPGDNIYVPRRPL